MRDKKYIKQEFKNNKAILQCARQFGLVGDPTRMRICWLLCKHKELSVGKISKTLNVSVSVVSHSLKRLRQNQLVKSKKNYKYVFYSLSKCNFNSILKNSLSNL